MSGRLFWLCAPAAILLVPAACGGLVSDEAASGGSSPDAAPAANGGVAAAAEPAAGGTASFAPSSPPPTGGSDATGYYGPEGLVNPEGWVGGDPAWLDDNPMGIQGAFYVYGDDVTCTCGAESCAVVGNPCTSGSCCLAGATIVDNTYESWGCGIGLQLNSSGGDPAVKEAYLGPASCFDILLSGSSGGNSVRVSFTQLSDTTDTVAPFVDIGVVDGWSSSTVCFNDVSCPSWADSDECVETGENFDIQIQIVGAERNAPSFQLCLVSLIPY